MQPLCTEQPGCDRNLLCLFSKSWPHSTSLAPFQAAGCELKGGSVCESLLPEALALLSSFCVQVRSGNCKHLILSLAEAIKSKADNCQFCFRNYVNPSFQNNSWGYKDWTSGDPEVGVSHLEGTMSTSAFGRYPAPRPFSCCPDWHFLPPHPYLP